MPLPGTFTPVDGFTIIGGLEASLARPAPVRDPNLRRKLRTHGNCSPDLIPGRWALGTEVRRVQYRWGPGGWEIPHRRRNSTAGPRWRVGNTTGVPRRALQKPCEHLGGHASSAHVSASPLMVRPHPSRSPSLPASCRVVRIGFGWRIWACGVGTAANRGLRHGQGPVLNGGCNWLRN